MKRLLALTGLILALGSLPFGALAVGLGNIQLHSALGQRLDADIALVGADKQTATALKVNLASAAEFDRARINQTAILQSLKFEVVPGNGGYHVHVTSSDPVKEPFLTFLVSAQWPSGQMLREYTVLLDPPNYAASGGAVQAPVAQSAPADMSAPVAVQPVQPASETRAMSSTGGNYGPIERGETLWNIAHNLTSGDPAEVDQMMIAIYRANPNAFSGNINRMKAGYVLRVPDADSVRAIDPREAIAAVRNANLEFAAPSQAAATNGITADSVTDAGSETAATTDAVTTNASTAEIDAANAEGAHLQLVAPGDADGSDAAPGNAEAAAAIAAAAELKEQLAATQQQAQAATAQNAQLSSQIDSLKKELSQTKRLLSVQDQRLSQLQNQIQQQQSKQPADDLSAVDKAIAFVTTPIFLIGLLVVFVLIVGGAVIRRQQRKAAAVESAAPILAATDEPEAAAQSDDIAEDVAMVSAAAAADPADKHIETALPDAPAEPGDPIAEADFHIDYGLYDQAADIVRKGIAADPGRDALKLKLFQIYFAAGDAPAFRSAAQEYASDWGADNPAEWDEVSTMGRQLVPDEPLFAAGYEESGGAVGAPTELPTEVDTALGIDTATEVPTEFGLDTAAGDGSADEDEIVADPRDEALDIDFDLGESAEEKRPEEKPDAAETDIGDLEFDVGHDGIGLEAGSGDNALDLDGKSNDYAVEPESGSDGPGTETQPTAGDRTDVSGAAGFDLSGLEAELDPAAGNTESEAGNPLLDTQTEFEDAIRELSEFVDTNFPKDAEPEATQVATGGSADEPEFTMPDPAIAKTVADDDNDSAFDDDENGLDEMDTKLDLARAYLDMGDPEGARSILEEVIEEGAPDHQERARSLLDKVG
ncbi:MAG TPA: FimV/HubP family polar landmark protein [Gammaproteobacteria bacterium]|nr:FimV/HubP family polar landmark protein [Gammaproteobacteria bacterium]